ncbi:MAG: membrane protein insertion efficiency factor YidD [Dehalococcoidia bacterium]|nr:membrane protein insertion efficiency factor YidD [Dehalococcoidia bacterium]
MERGLLRGIGLYQAILSPILGGRCRFKPSCSRYGSEAIRVHGAGRGSLLTAWRLLRCTPLSRGGYDPVPGRRSLAG